MLQAALTRGAFAGACGCKEVGDGVAISGDGSLS
jgi:hypothetical protein